MDRLDLYLGGNPGYYHLDRKINSNNNLSPISREKQIDADRKLFDISCLCDSSMTDYSVRDGLDANNETESLTIEYHPDIDEWIIEKFTYYNGDNTDEENNDENTDRENGRQETSNNEKYRQKYSGEDNNENNDENTDRENGRQETSNNNEDRENGR